MLFDNPTAAEPVLQEAIQKVLRSSNMPMRRPSHDQPTFWSLPLTPTKIEPLAAGTWVNFLTLEGTPGFLKRVAAYVATTFGDQTISGVEFRFLFNGTLAPNMTLANDVDHNKISSTTFPAVFQRTFFLVGDKDKLILQARNTGVFQQLVCAAFFGWLFDNADGPDKNVHAVTADDS